MEDLIDVGAKCKESEAEVIHVSSDFGRDVGIGGSVGVGGCVDAVDKIWLVSGSVLGATMSEVCCSLPSGGRDCVSVEVMS